MKNSPRKGRLVEVELQEFQCQQCGNGVLRVDKSKQPLDTVPTQWPHKCSNQNCTFECYLAFPFPVIMYKGEEFVLAKHVRHLKPIKDK
ncbi:hypothetical protein CGH87_23380 [Vibrio parahaemolyticus]|nr:hypothetical protein [Vibrio parahaemolyticus]EGR3316960.1 hypothetical protein [Vibrio parahaemolyticus]KHF03866.1 hypothetical protein PO77_21570 [Vibrio parahaemolyticus]TOL90953.1 hypothetical protein CGH87_23380 [Vibrio parahaemolyticus]